MSFKQMNVKQSIKNKKKTNLNKDKNLQFFIEILFVYTSRTFHICGFYY